VSVFTNPASGAIERGEAYIRAVLGLVETRDPMEVLGTTAGALRAVVAEVPVERIGVAERPGKWSILHVLRHLADSEIVWAYRLRMVLAQERPALIGYDQDAWADRLGYAESDAADSLSEFDALRTGNLRLVSRASDADLKRVGIHVERGEESLERMVRLYAGHDILHLRQIDRIRAAVTA
jgi:hypothetical protein